MKLKWRKEFIFLAYVFSAFKFSDSGRFDKLFYINYIGMSRYLNREVLLKTALNYNNSKRIWHNVRWDNSI